MVEEKEESGLVVHANNNQRGKGGEEKRSLFLIKFAHNRVIKSKGF